jgi:hypothetical protein
MDPLTKRRLGTLVVFLVAAPWAYLAGGCESGYGIFGFASGFIFSIGVFRLIDDRALARDRDETLKRFLRPRFDEERFGGWRPHGRRTNG